jgi:RNA polymerase sigma-70 factor (ECF subfamily)
MPESSSASLTQAEALALHQRLLERDPVAPSDLACAYLDWLATALARANPRADPHDCNTAAEEAILAYLKRPQAYHPTRLPLDRYLRMAARADLHNLWRRERRHQQHRADLDVVEFSLVAGNQSWDEADDPSHTLERQEAQMTAQQRLAPRLEAARAGLSPQEAQALELLQMGERKTGPYAAALGITHLPAAEQRQQVKRVKDKLKKRLERAGDSRGERNGERTPPHRLDRAGDGHV